MAETKKFCIHSDGLGYCDVLSDDTVRHYCVEGPCPHEKIVEYEPVKHGRWLYVDGKGTNAEYECEECRGHVCFDEKIDGSIPHYKRCPNCGAKMDLEADHEAD